MPTNDRRDPDYQGLHERYRTNKDFWTNIILLRPPILSAHISVRPAPTTMARIIQEHVLRRISYFLHPIKLAKTWAMFADNTRDEALSGFGRELRLELGSVPSCTGWSQCEVEWWFSRHGSGEIDHCPVYKLQILPVQYRSRIKLRTRDAYWAGILI